MSVSPPHKNSDKKGDGGRARLWGNVIGAVLAVLLMQAAVSLWPRSTIPYSEFESAVAAGQVREVTIGADRIEGEFKTARDGGTHFATTRVEPALAEKLVAKGVKVTGQASSGLLAGLLSSHLSS